MPPTAGPRGRPDRRSTSFGRANKIGDGLHEVEIYRERCRIENGAQNLEELDIDLIDERRRTQVDYLKRVLRPRSRANSPGG